MNIEQITQVSNIDGKGERLLPTIPIVLASNNLYAKYVPVTIYSVLKNSSKDYFYEFYVFHTQLTSSSINHIKNIPFEDLPQYSISFIDLKEYLKGVDLYINGHISVETWYRFFIPTILERYEKVIYIDCDLIVEHDISKLYHEDIGSNYLGVCRNPVTFMRSRLVDIGVDADKYFNAGVLLYNINAWNAEKHMQTCLNLISKYPNLKLMDQDILNIACKNKVRYLDYKWNFSWQFFSNLEKLPDADLQIYLDAVKDIHILHYTTSIKPWSHPWNKYADRWWAYASKLGIQRDHNNYRDKLEHWWWNTQSSPLNLNHPKTFNEKIQWLKIYDSTPLKTKLSDKHFVRNWVKEKIGGEYLIPLLGIYNNFEEIDFNTLPNQFVIKCTHGHGYSIIVEDRKQLDLRDIRVKLTKWINENYAFKRGYELQYRDVPSKIIIEKFVECGHHDSLNNYRYYCFNGEVKYIQVSSRQHGSSCKVSYYDLNWVKQSWWDNEVAEGHANKPQKLEDMIRIAKTLSQGFSFVRVDLYYTDNDSIYFDAMSFTPDSGITIWSNEAINYRLGKMIILPKIAYDIDMGKTYKLPKRSKLIPYLLFPIYLMGLKKLRNKYLTSKAEELIYKLATMRVDIKNSGSSQNAVNVKAKGAVVYEPKWMNNDQGIGQLVSSLQLKQHIQIFAIKSGKLNLSFRGPDKRYNGKPLPIWIDYKSLRVNGKEILSKPIAAWHGKSIKYTIPVEDGQTVTVEIEQTYHQYSREELYEIITQQNHHPYICSHLEEFALCVQNIISHRRRNS